jgi:hypothetical protein
MGPHAPGEREDCRREAVLDPAVRTCTHQFVWPQITGAQQEEIYRDGYIVDSEIGGTAMRRFFLRNEVSRSRFAKPPSVREMGVTQLGIRRQ